MATSAASLIQGHSTLPVAGSGFSAMTSEDFAKIIFTELSKQDPLQPNDTNALIQQISGIRSIQSNMDLSNKLQDLVGQNEFASSTGLIGKKISGVSIDSERVTGVVKSVARTMGGTLLTLETREKVYVSMLDQIEAAPRP